MDGITPRSIDIFMRGMVAFASFIRELEREEGDDVLDAFVLAFKPVSTGCGTCDNGGTHTRSRVLAGLWG